MSSDVIQKIITANSRNEGSVILGANKFGISPKIGPPFSPSGVGYYGSNVDVVESGLTDRFDDHSESGIYATVFAGIVHNHSGVYAEIIHNHSGVYWDDIRIPANSLRLGNTITNYKQYYGSLYAPAFSGDGSTEEAFFMTQIPHSYKEGTHLYPHVHWSPSDSGIAAYDNKSIAWVLDCSWANSSGNFGVATSYSGIDSWTSLTPYEHRQVPCVCSGLNYIDGTGKTISSMIIGRVSRQSSRADDTYLPPAYLLEVDFHYQQDWLGSNSEQIK